MNKKFIIPLLSLAAIIFSCSKERNTTVSINGDSFSINGRPTYEGRFWQGCRIEGLLFNSRMVQGIFDDLNPETAGLWVYPDTKRWDPDRNTAEFISNMESWRSSGLLSFTINMQGGSPQGYSNKQPWHNSAFDNEGNLRTDYMHRLGKILDKADELGMAPVLGLFYFGQDERLKDETAIINAVNNTLDWLFDNKYRNVLIEINNECDVRSYDHEILKPERIHELIALVKNRSRDDYRFYAGTSYAGGSIPGENVVRTSDFILLHGNGVSDPDKITAMVDSTRKVKGYSPKPVLFNEDDHFRFNETNNNFIAAVRSYASWGYFDYRMKDEPFEDGYQSVPVDWSSRSERKKGFFRLLSEITGQK